MRYGGGEFEKPQIGFSEESAAELVELRELVYGEIFGQCKFVYHEMLPIVPHVDVYSYFPSKERPFYTYVTSGMSDLPMNSPVELGPEVRRTELVFYSSADDKKYQELLRRLAHFPHDNKTWLHWGHTMPNGTPPQPVFGSRHLDSFFFMPSIVKPDSELGDRLSLCGEPVSLVWCVPVSSPECQLKLDRGSDALYELFDRHRHPFVFSGDRGSYV